MGRAIARGFLDNGARVAVAGRRPESLEETIAGYPAERAVAITTDVSDRTSVEALVSQTLRTFGGLDVVISNAAGYESGQLADMPENRWKALFEVNVNGLYHLVEAASDALTASEATWWRCPRFQETTAIGGRLHTTPPSMR